MTNESTNINSRLIIRYFEVNASKETPYHNSDILRWKLIASNIKQGSQFHDLTVHLKTMGRAERVP